MEINISYDYEDLIEEIESDLAEGLLKLDDDVIVVRHSRHAEHFGIMFHYDPIIDYYYMNFKSKVVADPEKGEYSETLKVKDVLAEMKKYNEIP